MSKINTGISKAIQKREIVDGDIITLKRQTRSDIPNANGYIYTEKAFGEAMEFYKTYRNAGVYLAPVSADEFVFGEDKMIEINNEVYVKFHHPKINEDYRVGELIDWDDYTISFKVKTTDVSKNFIKYVISETKVQLRYEPLCRPIKGIPIDKISIALLDLSTIPFEALGVDLSKFNN